MAVVLATTTTVRLSDGRDPSPPHVDYPRIEQDAAIIDLVRTVPADQRRLVLRAAGMLFLHIWVADGSPQNGEQLRRAPLIEDRLRQRASFDLGQELRAYTNVNMLHMTAGTEGLPSRIVWTMPDGRALVIDTRSFPAPPPQTFGA